MWRLLIGSDCLGVSAAVGVPPFDHLLLKVWLDRLLHCKGTFVPLWFVRSLWHDILIARGYSFFPRKCSPLGLSFHSGFWVQFDYDFGD